MRTPTNVSLLIAFSLAILIARPAPVIAAPAATAEHTATSRDAAGGDLDEITALGEPRGRIGPDVAAGKPAIAAVLAAAYATAGLDRDPGNSWIRRARLGGLVPWLTVRTTRDTSWQDDQPEVGHGTTFEVRATWRLDRLVFDSHELQVATLELARRRERRRLASRVIRAYFTWRRAVAAAAGLGDERTAIRLSEAIAELDALTDGWFSGELARSAGHGGRAASEPRSEGVRP